MACFVFLGMAFSFIKLISSSDTLTKREAVILKICPPAIIHYFAYISRALQCWESELDTAATLPATIENGGRRRSISSTELPVT